MCPACPATLHIARRIYVLAQLLAACLACSIFAFVSGWGPLMPLTSMKQLDLNFQEAIWLWATGSAPERMGKGILNVTDMLAARKKSASKFMSKFHSSSKVVDNPDVVGDDV